MIPIKRAIWTIIGLLIDFCLLRCSHPRSKAEGIRKILIDGILCRVWKMKASAKDGEGAGRGPCGLRNSELGPRPRNVLYCFYEIIIRPWGL